MIFLTVFREYSMTNEEKYTNAFMESFNVDAQKAKGLKYQDVEEWDSVGHMGLVSMLEDAFDIVMEPDDIIAISSYEVGKKILSTNYNIEF